MLSRVRVLIIGASGYLGSEIRRQAAEAGHDVAGTQFSARRQGLRRLDIRDAEAVAGITLDAWAPMRELAMPRILNEGSVISSTSFFPDPSAPR